MNIKQKNKNQHLVFFVLMAILLPMVIAFVAYRYVASVNYLTALRTWRIRASAVLEELRVSADSGMYVCDRINKEFLASSDYNTLIGRMHRLNDEFDGRLSFLVWTDKGEVASATFSYLDEQVDWEFAFVALRKFTTQRKTYYNQAATENLRRIFGPHFFPEQHSNCYSGKNVKPIYADSSMRKPLAWVRVGRQMGLLVFFPEDMVKGIPGLENKISAASANGEFRLAATIGDQVYADKHIGVSDKQILDACSSFVNPLKLGKWYVFKSLLGNKIYGLCFVEASRVEGSASAGLWVPIWFMVMAGLFVSLRLGYQHFYRGVSLSLNIRRQLIILFVFSNALSLIILGLMGFDYLQQYRLHLQQSAFNDGIRHLQSIDDMYVSEFSLQLKKMEASLPAVKKFLMTAPPEKKIVEEFLARQSPSPFRLFIVGSHTPVVASEMGIMHDGKFVEEINYDMARFESMRALVEAMGKLGSYYLALLNREPLSKGVQIQVELIAESFGQLRPVEMFQEFYAAMGSFWQWGMGLRYYPAYIDIFYLFDEKVADYVFLYLFKPDLLQHNYISRIFQNVNRNPMGIKVMAVDEDFRYSFPDELLKHNELRQFAWKLRERTSTDIEFCEWEGERYLIAGLKCSMLGSQRLIGLLPVESIEKKVRSRRVMLILFALVSVMVSVALSLFVARTVLKPLEELQKGMKALVNRDFSHRLPFLGKDEFGSLADVFNDTLVDLEELQVAATFQEKLVGQADGVETFWGHRIYCSTIASGRHGGNLVERIGQNEACFRMLMGDVGHDGIAQSLTLAFVRTAVEQLYRQQSGSELLSELNSIILSSARSDNPGPMAIQYLMVAENGVEVINSGYCAPVLVDGEAGRAGSVVMSSAVSGNSDNLKNFSELIRLKRSQALVFYSPSLLSCCDFSGSKHEDMFLGCFAEDPQAFFANIAAGITALIPEERPEKDISIVIVSSID